MIPQANITAWREFTPWLDDAQVEQDLVLSRVVVELFAAPELAGRLALRGGTALNKLLISLPGPSAYSDASPPQSARYHTITTPTMTAAKGS